VLRTVASWDAALGAFTALTGTRAGDVAWAPGNGSSTLTLWALWHALATGVDAVATGAWRGVPARAPVLDAVTVLHCVPAVLADVLTAREHGALPALRTAVVAGAPLLPGLRRRAEAAGLSVVEYYGAAELSFVAADPDGAGLRAFPGCEVRVRDGEIEVRSPYVSSGYVLPGTDGPWRRTADGWAGVGDRGLLTPDGVLEVAGRGGAALSVGGHVVLVADVERVLGGVDGVLEVVCVGLPDGRLGQRACAVVRTADGGGAALLRTLRAAARRELPSAARPVRYLLVDDLPRSPSGKADLRQLADLLTVEGAALT
jgi:acyl-CoA synthetase (AMP-forming)/AMP-acid ligase II